MKPILQSEASECALASLAMVANAHGLQLDLADLRRRFPVSLKGATFQQLTSHASTLNFSSRPFSCGRQNPKLCCHSHGSHLPLIDSLQFHQSIVGHGFQGARQIVWSASCSQR